MPMIMLVAVVVAGTVGVLRMTVVVVMVAWSWGWTWMCPSAAAMGTSWDSSSSPPTVTSIRVPAMPQVLADRGVRVTPGRPREFMVLTKAALSGSSS